MQPRPLPPTEALSLRIAADPRLSVTDYADDQIWGLTLAGGEPAALALNTSYGLRARTMRLFISFGWHGQTKTDPASFVQAPVVDRALPSYLKVNCLPFDDLHVLCEYWAAASQAVAGRITVVNRGSEAADFQLRLHAVLRPQEPGEPMGGEALQGVSVLCGQSGGLEPLLFLSGGALAELLAHPALTVSAHLQPGQRHVFRWAHAGMGDREEGFALARGLAAADWEAEIAKVELVNGRWVEIESGEPAWDAALAMTQKVGLGCLLSGSEFLPHPSFVLSRGVDDGHSARGDGRDYDDHWSGQSPLASLYLAWQLLPAAPQLVEGILRNYLYVQGANGEIDARPGLAGQRTHWQCPPLLATMAWEIFQQTESRALLRECLPALLEFAEAWFKRRHDRDGDGAPEWDHPLQSEYPESPTFVPWADWGQGLRISSAESADLLAYLLAECGALIAISHELGRTEILPDLETRATGLRRALARSREQHGDHYGPLDRDLHVVMDGGELGRGVGEFTAEVGRKFDPMVRLVIRTVGPESASRRANVTVHGRGPKGQFRTERLDEKDFRWFWELGSATTVNTFASIQRVEVRGLAKTFQTTVRVADHRRIDLSQMLPLWAEGADAEGAASVLDGHVLSDRFWRPYGLPSCSSEDPAYHPDERFEASGVRMAWNHLMGEALLAAGRRSQAAELVTRLMKACCQTLETDGGFRARYDPETGRGLGRLDAIEGLAPLALFLRVLGVRLIDPWTLELEGTNPYPWPVSVRWRGLTVQRPTEGPAKIRFPDGREIEVEGAEPRRVEARS